MHAANSRGMRFWSPGFIAKEIQKLADLGVRTLRISDEMFFLNRRVLRAAAAPTSPSAISA